MGVETLIVAGILGGLTAAGASVYGGVSANEEAKKKAAFLALQRKEATQMQAEKAARLKSSQQAAIGASGAAASGTPILAMMDSAFQGLLEMNRTRNSYDAQYKAAKKEGKAALIGGILGGAAGALSTAATAGMTKRDMDKGNGGVLGGNTSRSGSGGAGAFGNAHPFADFTFGE